MEKERADILVVRQGLTDSREKAKRYIMAGQIYTDKAMRVDKPGEKLAVTTALILKGEDLPYVSRGGLKLVKAMEAFDIHFEGKRVLDIGSSTGGFTDVALQNGAAMSFALDVGTNQLDWKLRSDDRVVVMEQTNFRYSKVEDFTSGQPDIATIDVSFISLDLILPPLRPILTRNGQVIALVKPQFEAGKNKVGKKGIVRDRQVHKDVLVHTLATAVGLGFDVDQLTFSPITGGTGNIEFLMLLTNTEGEPGSVSPDINIDSVIEEAHAMFH